MQKEKKASLVAEFDHVLFDQSLDKIFSQTLGADALGVSGADAGYGLRDIAVAVSGGADSMALLYLMARWCEDHSCRLHVLSVDHGLRVEAAAECDGVARYCKTLGGDIIPVTLTWDDPAAQRVQEAAREARYALMRSYCAAHGIKHLCVAHHADDQAETFLFRIAKGSGLDGLAGMHDVQNRDGLYICRPFLDIAKDDLLALCAAQDIPYVEDPSNGDAKYARVRLRQSADVLAAEGLSAKRLQVVSRRMRRAREALDFYAEKSFEVHCVFLDSNRIELRVGLFDAPQEIALRVVIYSMTLLIGQGNYPPRLERVEALVDDACHASAFRTRTLGGVMFARDDARGIFMLTKEKAS